MKTIDAKTLRQKLDEKSTGVTVVNVLSQMYFEQKHIPGSINIPLDEIEKRVSADLPEKDAEIIVHCTNTACQASPTAAKKLEEMGYTNVIDFVAGIEGWEEAGFALEGSDVKVSV